MRPSRSCNTVCQAYPVRLVVIVLAMLSVASCSATKATRTIETSSQPDSQKSVRQEIHQREADVPAQNRVGENAMKSAVPSEDSQKTRAGEQDETPARTDQEKLSNMDEKLDESLREFDEILLKKNQEISQKKQQIVTGEQRDGANTATEHDDEGGRGGASARTEEIERDGSGAQRNESAATPSGPGSGKSIFSGQSKDFPDGSDDDVVARQLREAAEKETDPELKKKLWEEYRRYKEG